MAIRALIAPSRYVQGKDALLHLGENLKRLGNKPLLVAGDTSWKASGEKVAQSLEPAGFEVVRLPFAGYTTAKVINEIADEIKRGGYDIVVGFGGGSCIDAVKSAGHIANIKWASVPTIASTDAPCSALAVVYTEDGAFEEYRFFPHNPDFVLVDSQLVADAPVRYLIGGIGDALATYPEALAVYSSGANTMAGALPTASALTLSKLCWDTLHEYGMQAVDAVKHHVVTPALERVIEANTLLSGIGFESGGLAAAHAIHDGLTAATETHGMTHGEKVAIGTMAMFVLEGRPDDEVADFVEFTTRIGLPNTLTEANLRDVDDATLWKCAEAATAEGETIHTMPFKVTAEDVFNALKGIEGFSRSVRAARGLPEPKPIGH
jgi:glycerol dehydrogenase